MDINQTLKKKNKKGTQLAKYCSFEQILLQQHTHTQKKSLKFTWGAGTQIKGHLGICKYVHGSQLKFGRKLHCSKHAKREGGHPS